MARTHPRCLIPLWVLIATTACADPGDAPDTEEADTVTEHAHTNRLIHEKSPYLLQHAHNPVDWYPWGEEAFAKARELNKPIFLSVGYSTCHWCHVMERESFENEEIAALLNEYFVCVKVDREERPDVDELYMAAVQGLNRGQGGWPMSVFLTPDLVPFFGATYIPPDAAYGRPGMRELIPRLGQAWNENRDQILTRAAQIKEYLEARATSSVSAGEAELTPAVLDTAFQQLADRFDAMRGGFGDAPKFPTPHQLTFLFRYFKRTGNEDALRMATSTLDHMAKGGLHDHLAGGFHRYSTDGEWLVPHFEKMLYDQAGLALAYTDAWLLTREPVYEAVTRGILDYVLATMTHEHGGFFSAEDADSEGEEGTFYVWQAAEVDSILGTERGAAFRSAYDVTDGGNWEGKNILHVDSLEALTDSAFTVDRTALLAARDGRVRPHLDDKIVTAWNGFMMEAFARAGRAFDEPRYVRAGENAAAFVHTRLWKDGRLLRHYRDGAADIPAYLDDYAFLGRGLVALYEATFDPGYVEQAVRIAGDIQVLFRGDDGVFRMTGADAESLIVPVTEIYDGAMPSAASAATTFLLRAGHLVANADVEGAGRAALGTYSGALAVTPAAYLEMLAALDFALGPVREVVIAGDREDALVGDMRRTLNGAYLPNTVIAFNPTNESPIRDLVPYLKEQVAIEGRATAYVCESYACKLPVHDASAMKANLGLE